MRIDDNEGEIMSLSKFLDPKNDYAFKRIFGAEKNKDILIPFLNDILGFSGDTEIKEVTFLKPIQDPEIASKKQSIVDVLCKDAQGVQYIIEMQVAKTAGFEKRAQYYAAKAYVNQFNQGDKYKNLKEVIFLAIADFTMFPDKLDYMSKHVILDKCSHEHNLKDFSFTFLELPKFNKGIEELTNIVERWSYFFKHADETSEADLERIIGHNIVLRKAYKELDQFYWTEEELATYEAALKNQRDAIAIIDAAIEEGEARAEVKAKAREAIGEARGKVIGEAIGEVKGIEKVASNLLAQGVDIKTIIAVTGLSVAKIQALKEKELVES